jgi:hypothetical protein
MTVREGVCRHCGEEATVNASDRCFDCFYERRGWGGYAEEADALEQWESEPDDARGAS